MPPNIEKSAFRRGEYVGYSGGVWRISRHGTCSNWVARHSDPKIPAVYGFTLAEVGEKLEALEALARNPAVIPN